MIRSRPSFFPVEITRNQNDSGKQPLRYDKQDLIFPVLVFDSDKNKILADYGVGKGLNPAVKLANVELLIYAMHHHQRASYIQWQCNGARGSTIRAYLINPNYFCLLPFLFLSYHVHHDAAFCCLFFRSLFAHPHQGLDKQTQFLFFPVYAREPKPGNRYKHAENEGGETILAAKLMQV